MRAAPLPALFRAASAIVALAALTLALTSCGLGPGEQVGDGELTVTRDFGSEVILERELTGVSESDTVIRLLEQSADIETRFGGGFVHAIEGLGGGSEAGRPHDWFYFVNGVEADRGSADFSVADGDRIWWDYRDWSAAMSVPAVVGSYPEPFINGYDGGSSGARVECRAEAELCDLVARQLEGAGVDLATESTEGAIAVLVGAWPEIGNDPKVRPIDSGPDASGVFGRFRSDNGEDVMLEALATDGSVHRRLGPGAGLVAAVARAGSDPAWIVTGTDPEGTYKAAEALRPEVLSRNYAVAVDGDRVQGLPAR